MPEAPPVAEPPPLPAVRPAAKDGGCFRKILVGCGTLMLAGVIVAGLSIWPFVNRTRRANSFAHHVREGDTVREVFAGPRDWDDLSVQCTVPGKEDGRARIVERGEGSYLVFRLDSPFTRAAYPAFEAVLNDLAAGTGPFAGRHEIDLVYKFYVVSGTFVLTLGPDGKVTKIERISRG